MPAADEILLARPVPNEGNPGLQALDTIDGWTVEDNSCTYVRTGLREAWASGWASPAPGEPMTVATFKPASSSGPRPNNAFKRARLAARTLFADRTTGDLGSGGGRQRLPFFFFRVTRVQFSGKKYDNVTGSLITLGIGPIHGFMAGLEFSNFERRRTILLMGSGNGNGPTPDEAMTLVGA